MGIGWIIRARGIAPSIGAGGTIVVAALCCLVFVSALLTFRSWPSGGGSGSDGSLVLRVPEAKAAGRTGAQPAPVRRAAVPAARRDRRGSGPSDRVAAGGGRSRGGSAAPRARFRGPVPAVSRPAAPAPAAAQSATAPPSSPPSAGDGSQDPVVPVPPLPPQGTVESTIGTAGSVVENATRPLPPAPPLFAQPVQDTLDTAQGVARTVDGVLLP